MDIVQLRIGDRVISEFASYKIENDIFNPASAPQLEIASPEFVPEEGQKCELYVNNQRELTGMILRIQESYDKQSHKLALTVVDWVGLMTKYYVEEPFFDLAYEDPQSFEIKKISLQNIVDRLLPGFLLNVPVIRKMHIMYGKGNKNRATELKQKEDEFDFAKINKGQTYFDVFREAAIARGLIFFSLPDGTLMFTEPVSHGHPEFQLISDGQQTNILSCDSLSDITDRYSRVMLYGSKEDSDDLSETENQVSGSATDDSFPFYKPFVATSEYDAKELSKQARLIMDKQRVDGKSLTYKIDGHSQWGKNWQVNALCHVKDTKLKKHINGRYLIFNRTFEKSKGSGTTTTLKLSEPGVYSS